MGLFRQQKAIERLDDRLRALEIKNDEVERAYRGLCLEYEELWDKVRRQMARMSKRVAVDKKEALNAAETEPAEEDAVGPDPISASILRRRGMGP